MGRKVKHIEIETGRKAQLQQLHKTDKRHCVRQRSQIILLKAEGYNSKEISRITDCCEASANNWIKRFEQSGIEGLFTQAGRGRKPILQEDNLAVIRSAVTQERQRLSQAKLIIEQQLDKQFSQRTLTRFLKVITAVTSE